MNIPAVVLANIFGVLLAIVLFSKKANSFDIRNKETKITSYMLIIAVASCVLDCLACVIESHSGGLVHFIVYAVNLWLFLSNIIWGHFWVLLVAVFFRGHITAFQKYFLIALSACTLVLLAINFTNPILFYVDSSNVYHRGNYYAVFVVMDIILIIEGIVDYIIAKHQGGRMVFFPIWQFVLPALTGIVIQAVFYGVSAIWPCIIISLCAVKLSFQAEASYKDRLTGLFNRYYLDIIRKSLKKDSRFAILMFDLNSFKQINDIHGHQEGDKAIYQFALLLKQSLGSYGFIIRFAGDEFIVFFNSSDEGLIERCINKLRKNLDEYNKKQDNKYELSFSCGYCLNDAEDLSLAKMIGMADKMMFDNKRDYYQTHAGMNRRGC